MKKILFFSFTAIVVLFAVVIFSDVTTLKGYAQKVGSIFGYGTHYTEKSVNAVQDSVKSAASAIDDIRENKARAIIEEQRKKIQEMREELEEAMKSSENKNSQKN